jgi:hypothetical protein
MTHNFFVGGPMIFVGRAWVKVGSPNFRVKF